MIKSTCLRGVPVLKCPLGSRDVITRRQQNHSPVEWFRGNGLERLTCLDHAIRPDNETKRCSILARFGFILPFVVGQASFLCKQALTSHHKA